MQRSRGEFDLGGVHRQLLLYIFCFIFKLGDEWYTDVGYIIHNIFLSAWNISLLFKTAKFYADILLFESQVA